MRKSIFLYSFQFGGASVLKGFTKNISEISFKHSFLHSLLLFNREIYGG